MKDWPSVALGDIFEIARGGSPRPIQNFLTEDPNGVNWIMIGDASDSSKYITQTKKRILRSGIKKSRMVYPGDFLLTNSMSFGHPYIMKTSGCIHDGWLVLSDKNKKGSVDHDYFYHLLGSDLIYSEFSRRASGSTVKNLNIEIVKGVEVSLPPLEDQRRIAAILDQADAVRRKRKEAIALTEELLRSAFLEMFGDPVTNPKGWEVTELERVCHKVTDGTHQPPKWVSEGIPFLFVSNIVNGEIDFNVSKYITQDSWQTLTARSPIEVNDILYTTVGSYGNAALVRTEKRFCFQRHIAHIKPDTSQVNPEFLLGLMQSDGIRQQADRQVRGIAQKTLNLRELKKFQVLIPPFKAQENYVVVRRKLEKLLNEHLENSEESEKLFDSLLQRAFRGELSA
jgi:type I restriction enzyme, S subunit